MKVSMKNIVTLLLLEMSVFLVACGSNPQNESSTPDVHDSNTPFVMVLEGSTDHTLQVHSMQTMQDAYDALVACDGFKDEDPDYYYRVKNVGKIRVDVTDTGGVNCGDSFQGSNLYFIDGKCSTITDGVFNILYMTTNNPHENAYGYPNVKSAMKACGF